MNSASGSPGSGFARIVPGNIAAVEAAFGYNAETGEYGDMTAMRCIDPTQVARLGLRNAASIASLILTTDCITLEAQKHGELAQQELPRGD